MTKKRLPRFSCEACGQLLKVTTRGDDNVYECLSGCWHCPRCYHSHPRGHVCDVPPPPPAICAFCGSQALLHWYERSRRWVLYCKGEPTCYVCIGCMEWAHRDDRNQPECIYCGDTDIVPRCTECSKEFVCWTCEPARHRPEKPPCWVN